MLSAEKIAKLRAAGLEVHTMTSGASAMRLPLYLSPVQAGLPAQAGGDLDAALDLGEWLVPYPEHSFLVRVKGDSMVDLGILEGDLLVVEQGRKPRMGDLLVAEVRGQFTVKQLGRHQGKVALLAGNAAYAPILVVPGEVRVNGVVRSVARRYAK